MKLSDLINMQGLYSAKDVGDLDVRIDVEAIHQIISASTIGNYAANYEWTMELSQYIADNLEKIIKIGGE